MIIHEERLKGRKIIQVQPIWYEFSSLDFGSYNINMKHQANRVFT